MRPVGQLETMVRAVTLIPGTTEFGYEPATVVRDARARPVGAGEPPRRARARPTSIASLDDLQGVCPNLERVAVVVAWFGNDLRAGDCAIKPGVENDDKRPCTARPGRSPASTARGAHLVSTVDGRPAYGGTPSDAERDRT